MGGGLANGSGKEKGLSSVSAEGRSGQEEGPAIATHATPGVNGHGNHGPEPNPQAFFTLHPHTFSGEGEGEGEGGTTQLPGRGCGGPCFPWIQWLIWGGVEGPSIVRSIACPEIPGKPKKGPGIARAEIMGVGGSVGYAAFQNPMSVLP